jgi:hypothetical protein
MKCSSIKIKEIEEMKKTREKCLIKGRRRTKCSSIKIKEKKHTNKLGNF